MPTHHHRIERKPNVGENNKEGGLSKPKAMIENTTGMRSGAYLRGWPNKTRRKPKSEKSMHEARVPERETNEGEGEHFSKLKRNNRRRSIVDL